MLCLAFSFLFLLLREKNEPSFLLKLDQNGINSKIKLSKDDEIHNLQNRLQFLEKAVRELQEKVYNLSINSHYTYPVAQKLIEKTTTIVTWSCLLRNPFGRVFTGTANNRIKAEALTLQSCGASIHCNRKKTECSPENKITTEIISKEKSLPKIKNKSHWSCLIQNHLNKTFLGEGTNRIIAEAKALSACGSTTFCPKKNLHCDQN